MEQPFYIGQKVVALTTDKVKRFKKKGQIFTVLGLSQCPKCLIWCIDIGERETGIDSCDCGYSFGRSKIYWHYADVFAPLQEGFEAITFERVMEEEKVSVN